MTKVVAPRFDLDECRNELEREFIDALHRRAEAGGWYADGWRREDRIIVTVDISDADYNCILRMLRVDYDGSVLTAGPDETYQLATNLDPSRPDVILLDKQAPTMLANAAADWLEREMKRPILRQEWDRSEFSRRLWVLADTGQELVFSDSANAAGRMELGPPDNVVRLTVFREPPA